MRGLWVFLACTGCGLYDGGPSSVDGPLEGGVQDGGVDGVVNDSPTDVVVDVYEEPGPPLPCTTEAGVCTGALAKGWTPIAFEANRALACPSNFTNANVITAPMAIAGACTCSCNVVTKPSCALGTVTLKYGGDNQCGTTYTPSFNITTEGQCVDYLANTFNLVAYHSYTKLPLTMGTCNGMLTTDASKVAATPWRTCAPPTACAEDVCNGSVPMGMRSCIMNEMNVACPPGPFTDRVGVVGDTTKLACSACTNCNVTQSACANGTVKFWGDAQCTVAKGSITADGLCNATGGGQNVNHFTYENPAQNVVCNAGSTGPTASLDTERTICCRP